METKDRATTERLPRGGEFPAEIPRFEGNFRDFLRWRRQRRALIRSYRERGERLPQPVPTNGLLRSGTDSVTWAGHASVVARLAGKTVLSDPVWSNRIALVVKRLSPAAPDWNDVPAPDLITISHNHYDHLDAGTMRRVRRDTPVAVPFGVGPWFRKRGFQRVHEFRWGDTHDVDGLRVTFVPSRHFSGRTLWDRNKSYFGGWVVETRTRTYYHCGDSGYFDGFRAIGERFPNIDVACLPVGAYEPRWFMRSVHVDPDECGQAFLDTRATRLLPIHWGTFRLTDEPMDEPPERIRRFFETNRIDANRLLLPGLGETLPL